MLPCLARFRRQAEDTFRAVVARVQDDPQVVTVRRWFIAEHAAVTPEVQFAHLAIVSLSRAPAARSMTGRPGHTAACRARSGRITAHQQPGHDTSDPDSTGTGNSAGGMGRFSHGCHTRPACVVRASGRDHG